MTYRLQRDGEKATRAWVERTVRIYREAITKPGSHASNTTYRPLFEKAIHGFEEWLAMLPSAGTTSVLEHVR